MGSSNNRSFKWYSVSSVDTHKMTDPSTYGRLFKMYKINFYKQKEDVNDGVLKLSGFEISYAIQEWGHYDLVRL